MEKLLNLLRLENKPWKNDFADMAIELMSNYIIKKGNIVYEFAEIEFYLYCEEHKDTSVYPRYCKAGECFYHYSGMDIAFETCTDAGKIAFGGILIRSLLKIGKSGCKELIAGPLRCKDELLNGDGAIRLERATEEIHFELCRDVRCGITHGGKESKPYRYYHKRDKWIREYIKPLSYTREKTVVKDQPIRETYSSAPKGKEPILKI